ncbi:unnamed protein product [Coregonus sp. 'balchen']|nr:unnamed protein product [Coregonus sp. 'balchen']
MLRNSSEKVRQRTRFATSSYKQVFSIDSQVEWPAFHSSKAEVGSNGEAIVSSVEGRANLLLSPSEEEFSDVTYQLRSLPPDTPVQVYSVRSMVTRANSFVQFCWRTVIFLESRGVLQGWAVVRAVLKRTWPTVSRSAKAASRRPSRAIQDINNLLSATTLTLETPLNDG